jgi:prefoldin subunit 5
MKEFSKFQIATIKRTAQSVNPIVSKKNRLKAQIAEFQAEVDSLEIQQNAFEAPIKEITGGYTTEDLVDKVVTGTGKFDKSGVEIKTTKYVLKYPETIVPVKTETEIAEHDSQELPDNMQWENPVVNE